MTILASSILANAAKQLQDDTNIAWPLAELLEWLNMGRRQIAIAKPDVFVRNESIQFVAGTKQTIPAAGNIFVKLPRNMGANGTTPGPAIRPIPLNVLDEQMPNWHGATPSTTAQHYGYDERDPRHFYIYPPQPATGMGYAEIVYSATPDPIGQNDPIGLPDLYDGALFNFVLAMAYAKDSEYTRNDAKSDAYMKMAGSLVAGMSIAEAKNDAGNSTIGNQRANKKAA
jgi:hypothetical protein